MYQSIPVKPEMVDLADVTMEGEYTGSGNQVPPFDCFIKGSSDQ